MKLKLHTQIFIAIVLGVLVGYFFKDITPAYIAPFGDIFMRLLRLLVIPLVLTSVTLGVVSISDKGNIGSISLKTFAYFVLTGIISTTLGLFLVGILKPGVNNTAQAQALSESVKSVTPPSIQEIIVNMAPQNIFESLANGEILPVIIFAIMLGVALGKVGLKGKPLVSLFDATFAAIMKITDWVIALTPIGVLALTASTVSTLGISSLLSVGSYFGVVVLGLLIHAVIIVPLILKVFANYSPITLFRKILPAIAIGAPTASSAAAFPVTMECLNKSVGVPNRVTSFVISLGTTMNMDGTALYQGVAVMFIAQMYGIDLGLGAQAVIVLTALLASVGAAATPGTGMVTMVMILNAVGVPIEGIAFILVVDRVLDSCRTPVNIWSNICGAVIVAKLEGEKITEDYQDELEEGLEGLLHEEKDVVEVLNKNSERELEVVGKSREFFKK